MVTPDDTLRRLHPATIALGAVARGPSTLFALPAVVAVVPRSGIWPALGIVAGLSVVAMLVGWLHWHRFTYAVTDGEVRIARGLFHRTRRSIPFDRIQDVAIEQGPVARLFALAKVRIETGGGKADEALLDSVSLAEARRLRMVLRAGDGAAASVAAVAPERAALFVMTPGRVLTMGAFGFSLIWVGVLFAGLNQIGDVIGYNWIDVRDIVGVAKAEAMALATPLFAAVAAVVALAAGVVSGIVRTLLVEHGFRLERDGDRLRRTRGLLTRTEVVVSLRRVQLALIERGMVSGRFGWSSLRLQTLGGSDDAGGRQSVAPFARDEEVAALLAAADYPRFDPLPLRPVAMGHVVRAVLLRGGLPLVAIGLGSIFAPLVALALVFVPVPVAVALMVRRRHRYAIVGDTLQVMRGVLRKQAWIVPLARIQAVSITRSPLQRLLGVATVRVGTAGAQGIARPDVIDLAVGDATTLAAALLRRG